MPLVGLYGRVTLVCGCGRLPNFARCVRARPFALGLCLLFVFFQQSSLHQKSSKIDNQDIFPTTLDLLFRIHGIQK
jgi:hypothetical protein